MTKAAPIAGAEVWPGKAYPLGASYDGFGTNFAVFSEVAERVELCLFDTEGAETRVAMPEVDLSSDWLSNKAIVIYFMIFIISFVIGYVVLN